MPKELFFSTIFLVLFFVFIVFIRGWHNVVGKFVTEFHPSLVLILLIGVLILLLALDYFFGKNFKKKIGSRSDSQQIWIHSNKKSAE